MKAVFDKISIRSSKAITQAYSTSFSLGIKLLARRFHNPIYALYGFVRLADEIVDSFHNYNKEALLAELRSQTHQAIANKISINPVLNSFQQVVHQYQLSTSHINRFLDSMQMDLHQGTYSEEAYSSYILGSAEVVGLMCLKVFTEGDEVRYNMLKPYAMKLGSALQKINFLRDFREDKNMLGRIYFPQLRHRHFTEEVKREIEAGIKAEMEDARKGITMLPRDVRFGVYITYIYYSRLLAKICNMPVRSILHERVRISDQQKYALIFGSYLRHSLNLI